MANVPGEIHRGEVWLVEFGGSGSEIQGRRPAVVLQNDVGNRFAATTIVAAVTTRAKALPILVPLPAGAGGLKVSSSVNLSQVFTVARGRLERRLGSLDAAQVQEVNRAIRVSLAV